MTRSVTLRLAPPRASGPTRRGARGRLAAAIALAASLASSATLAIAPDVRAWDPNAFSQGSEAQLISLQNQARASGGRRTLKLDTDLRRVARWRSRDMVERDYFSHTIPGKGADHNVFWYLQYEYGYCFNVAGENIGNVTWSGASEEDVTNYVFDLFMDSSGHRANIMGRDWDVVAVGAYRSAGDYYVWTALFADRCGGGGGDKATPKPTPRPTPKPARATPKPQRTERSTPKPQRTQAPTPKPSRAPRATATPSPRPTPTLSPSPPPTPTPSPRPSPTPTPSPSPVPTPEAWGVADGQGASMRVVDAPAGLGLVDSILSTVTARFFGT